LPISRAWAIALLVLVHLAWSGHLIAGRILVRDIPPFTLSFLRWALATPLLFLWARKREPPRGRVRRGWPLGLALGLTGTYGFTAVLYLSLANVSAAESGLIYGFTPALLSLFSMLFLGERPGPLAGLGIALSVLGVFVTVGPPSLQLVSLGDVYALLATLSWAMYTVLGRWAMNRRLMGPVHATYLASLYALPLGFIGSAAELSMGYRMAPTAQDLALLAYASAIAAALAFAGWYVAVEAIGPNAAAPFSNLIPLFAPLLSFLLLGEGLSLRQIGGGALIVAGAALASLSPLPASPSRPRPA
jgi:drug/metabolite transporter (DMT)-like permease